MNCEDGTKVDYIIWPVALLQRILGAPKLPDLLDHGYQVLVDKDQLASQLKLPPIMPIFLPGRQPTSINS